MVLYPSETEAYLLVVMKDKLKEKPFFADAVPNPEDEFCPWKFSSNPATHDVYQESLGKLTLFAMHVYYYHSETDQEKLDFEAFHTFSCKILEKVCSALELQCDQDTALDSFHILLILESTLSKFRLSLVVDQVTDKNLTESKKLISRIADLCKGENTSVDHMKLIKFFISNLDLDYDILYELLSNKECSVAKEILSAQTITMYDTDEAFAEMSNLYFVRPHYSFYMADEEEPNIEAAPTTFLPLGGSSESVSAYEEDALSTFVPNEETLVSKSTLDDVKRIELIGKSDDEESSDEMDKLIVKLFSEIMVRIEKENNHFVAEEVRFIFVALFKIFETLRIKFIKVYNEEQLKGYVSKVEEIVNHLRIVDIIKASQPQTVEVLLNEFEEFCSFAEPINFSALLNILCTVIVNWINAERDLNDETRMNRRYDWIKIKLHHIQLFFIAHQIPATERKLWANLLPVGVDKKTFVHDGVCSRCSKPINYDMFYIPLCSHSICKDCLEELENARDKSVSCSKCSKPFREVVPASRLENLASSLHSLVDQKVQC